MDYLALKYCLKAIRVSKFKRRDLSFNCNLSSSHTSEFKNNFILFGFKFLVLVFLFGFFSSTVLAQDPPPPFRPAVVNEPPAGSLGTLAKPEVVDCNSTITFSVEAVTNGVGLPSENTFTWKVFGGRIQASAETGVITNSQDQDYNGYNYQQSETTTTGWNADGLAEITIKWQNQDRSYAFIAVQQCGPYGCSEDGWSIYYVEIIKGLENFSVELKEVTNACPFDNIVATVDFVGVEDIAVDSWQFVVSKKIEGISNYEEDYINIKIGDCTPVSEVVNGTTITKYRYIFEIPTIAEDIGKTVSIQINNFFVALTQASGGNITTGTIIDPDGELGPLLPGVLTGEVYEPPNTSQIEHN